MALIERYLIPNWIGWMDVLMDVQMQSLFSLTYYCTWLNRKILAKRIVTHCIVWELSLGSIWPLTWPLVSRSSYKTQQEITKLSRRCFLSVLIWTHNINRFDSSWLTVFGETLSSFGIAFKILWFCQIVIMTQMSVIIQKSIQNRSN